MKAVSKTSFLWPHATRISRSRRRRPRPQAAAVPVERLEVIASLAPQQEDMPAYNESFIGSLRDQLLDGEIFYALAEAKVLIEA